MKTNKITATMLSGKSPRVKVLSANEVLDCSIGVKDAVIAVTARVYGSGLDEKRMLRVFLQQENEHTQLLCTIINGEIA